MKTVFKQKPNIIDYLKNNIMKEYKTTIVDGYVLIVDDSEIKENTNTFNEGLNGDWFWNSIYNKIANTGDITSFDYKIIAHLPLNNYAVLQGVPLLPPIKKDDVEKLAEERFGTDIDSIRGSNPYDLNSDLKRGFTIGYNKHAEKYKYTEQDLRIAVELAITTGLTVDYFIARHEQPKLPISFNCEMKQKFEADKYKRKDIKNGVYYEPKTISTPNAEQWVGEWVY